MGSRTQFDTQGVRSNKHWYVQRLFNECDHLQRYSGVEQTKRYSAVISKRLGIQQSQGECISQQNVTLTFKRTAPRKQSNNLVIPANIRHTLLQTCVSVLLEENIYVATCVMMAGSGHLHNCRTDKDQGHKTRFLDPTRE